MSYSKFEENLKIYEPYEDIAGKKICKLNNVNILNKCKNYKYDFQTDDNLKYEVKTDKMSLSTGNFFIEFRGYNKFSGIITTLADHYIINDTNTYYLIPVIKLREITENRKELNTKDGSTSGYIINRATLSANSIII